MIGLIEISQSANHQIGRVYRYIGNADQSFDLSAQNYTLTSTWQLVDKLKISTLVEGFRWALLGDNFSLQYDSILISIAVTFAILISGLWFFRRTERAFADVV